MNIKRLVKTLGFCIRFTSLKRADYARRKNIFKYVGNNVRLPMMNLPLYPQLVSFHNNVEIASGVSFIVHDAIHTVVNDAGVGVKMSENIGCIEIMDNCFIGAGTIILPNVRIGPNAIIGAGSVVNKDIPKNAVCAGAPAKQIGTFDEYINRREIAYKQGEGLASTESIGMATVSEAWDKFNRIRVTIK